MFKDPVLSTPFSTPYAENALGFTNNLAYGEDESLPSTLRALLLNRLHGTEERINGWWSTLTLSKASTEGAGRRDVFRYTIRNINVGDGMFNICSMETGNNDLAFEIIQEYMPSEPCVSGYTKLEKITAYFRKSFKTLCYINENTKSVILFVDKLDVRKLHFIQCSITAMLPWYFPPEEKLNDDEMRLVRSLTKDSKEEYIAALQAIYDNNNVDFRKLAIERMLDGITKKIYQQKTRSIERDLDSINDRIDSLKDELVTYMARREDKQAILFGYRNLADKAESSELIDYFQSNKFVDIYDVDLNGDITFIPFGYLTFWKDVDMKDMLEYDRSYVFSEGSSTFNKDDRAMLTRAIFIDRKIKVRMCSAYRLSIGERRARGCSGFCFPGAYSSYMPNPHIGEYGCLGSNEGAIIELLESGEYIGAIDQCIMSSRSITLSDGAVTSKFFRKLFSQTSQKCLEAPDGTIMDTKEAIEYLKKEG